MSKLLWYGQHVKFKMAPHQCDKTRQDASPAHRHSFRNRCRAGVRDNATGHDTRGLGKTGSTGEVGHHDAINEIDRIAATGARVKGNYSSLGGPLSDRGNDRRPGDPDRNVGWPQWIQASCVESKGWLVDSGDEVIAEDLEHELAAARSPVLAAAC